MKKTLCFCLISVLMLCFSACIGAGGNEIYQLHQTATFDNLKITATDVDTETGDFDDLVKPQEGNKFIGIEFEIKNISKAQQSISNPQFTAFVKGQKVELSTAAQAEFLENGTLERSIAPGKKIEGVYAIEATIDTSQIEIHFQFLPSDDSSPKAIFKIHVPSDD